MQGEAFVVGAIGNFSGWRHPEALEEHRSRARFFDIDRDNLDTVLARLAPRIQLDLPFCRTLRVSNWGDFHPDGLVERVPALQKLLEARANVGNPPLMRRCLEQAGVDFTRVSGEEDARNGRVDGARRSTDG